MPEPTCVAAAQTVPVAGDVAANIRQHLRLARLAARHRAQVVVFPELSLTGYELGCARALAFTPGDRRLESLREAVRRLGLTLVAGAPLRLGDRLHIGALMLCPDGRIPIYTKRHLGAFSGGDGVSGPLPPAERTVFAPGRRDPLLRLGPVRAAVAICADTGRPSHPRRAAGRGARLYLAGVFTTPGGMDREAAMLAGYARRHRMAVVMANHGGPSGGLPAAGRSAIWSETGERIVRLALAGAGVAVARRGGSGWRTRAIRLRSH